jgi:hypothetical protein
MDSRQLHAITHPVNYVTGDPGQLAGYRTVRLRGDGVYVVVILAVDR